MKGFVHLRTSLFLVISVTRVFLVTSQDATGGKWTSLLFLFLEIDLHTLPLSLSEAGWTTVRYTAYSTAEGSSFGEMRFWSWYISKLLVCFFFSTTEPKWIVLVHCFNQSRTVPGVAGFWWTAWTYNSTSALLLWRCWLRCYRSSGDVRQKKVLSFDVSNL